MKYVVTITILIAALGALVWWWQQPTVENLTNPNVTSTSNATSPKATPTPLPAWPLLDENSDLEAAINDLDSPEYQSAIKKLQDQANQL